MKPIITAVTLGVRDLRASLRFYEALGFKRKVKATGDEIAFLDAGSVALILWHWNLLAEDEGLPANPVSAFRGSNLAWNKRLRRSTLSLPARSPLAPSRCGRRRRPITVATVPISPIPTATPGRWFARRASDSQTTGG